MSALPSVTLPRRRPDEDRPGRPHLRVVEAPRHTTPFALVLVATAVVGIFGIVAMGALAAESAFAARELETEIDQLTMRYEELTGELAFLESPAHVRHVAVSQLGMVPSRQPDYLVLGQPVALDGTEPAGAAAEEAPDGAELLADPVKPALNSDQG
ncbi:MAG TPA: hypothetical protein VML96_05470 [Egibacteraceae bacterium]|nr:hypothetical protein [Egibacteraceae bacterium]